MTTTHDDNIQDMAVIPGITQRLRLLPNGSMHLILEVDPEYRASAMHWFCESHVTVAVARLTPEASQQHCQTQTLNLERTLQGE